MSDIRINSKVTKMADYRTVDLSQFAVPLDVDEKAAEEQLIKYITRYSETAKCDSIEKRDLVELSCRSEAPRYNKEDLKIRVGLGLMGRDFENQLIGLKKGETRSLVVSDKKVEVSIREITREILPKVDDDFAKRCGIPGVSTAADLENYCLIPLLDEELDEPADNASAYLGGHVFDASEFVLDENEISMEYDETVKQLADRVPGDKVKEFAGQISISTVKAAAYGQKLLEDSGRLLTGADYKEHIEKRAVARECSTEDMKKEEPAVLYAIHEYSDTVLSLFETYATLQVIKYGREEK